MRGAFSFARRQHLHRCFISMDDVLGQHGFAQCIYQRLQLYAGLADPQSQRRTQNCQASTAMLFDREHAGGVVQLLADVFADALKLAAAGTLGVLQLVMNDGKGELRRQRRTLGLLAWFVRCRGGTKGLQLGVDGFKVGVEQVIEQATLRRADLLTALSKLVTFEDGDLVRELLDDGLVAAALSAHGVDPRQQLRRECAQLIGRHRGEIGRGSHAVDFTKAAPPDTAKRPDSEQRNYAFGANPLPRQA